MKDVLEGRNIALGVSGSIACYKALTIASRLSEAGALVDVLLTPAAAKLVTPLAFQALSHRPVVHDLWAPTSPTAVDHVAIARRAEVLAVAPATANIIAEMALGLARDALTTTALAHRGPLLLAPAMESRMWDHSATRRNLAALIDGGAVVVGPEEGRMASGDAGRGRMAEPDSVVDMLRAILARQGELAGTMVLVTAGPTREPLDPVRFLSNLSTGLMGHAVARAARDRGATVTLVSGPVSLAPIAGAQHVAVETAEEMRSEVLARAADADAVVMAAAVADFRPRRVSPSKMKKASGAPSLELEPTADILLAVAEELSGAEVRPVVVGFAAETDDLGASARHKLRAKSLDLVVANEVPASFGGGEMKALLVDRDGESTVGPGDKRVIADAVIDALEGLLATGAADS